MPSSVDLKTWPPDEKPHIVDLAVKHNDLSDDVNQISGSTLEEKEATWKLFGQLQKGALFLHGHRYNTVLFTIQAGVVIWILRALGFDTTKLGPILNHVLDLLARF